MDTPPEDVTLRTQEFGVAPQAPVAPIKIRMSPYFGFAWTEGDNPKVAQGSRPYEALGRLMFLLVDDIARRPAEIREAELPDWVVEQAEAEAQR